MGHRDRARHSWPKHSLGKGIVMPSSRAVDPSSVRCMSEEVRNEKVGMAVLAILTGCLHFLLFAVFLSLVQVLLVFDPYLPKHARLLLVITRTLPLGSHPGPPINEEEFSPMDEARTAT